MNDKNEKNNRLIIGIVIGIIAAIFSCIIVTGVFLLALSEGGIKLALPSPTSTSVPTTTTPLVSSTSAPTNTLQPTETTRPTATTAVSSPTATFTSSPTSTFTSTTPPTLTPTRTQSPLPPRTLVPTTPPQPPAGCGPPASWVIYIVQPGDTLSSIGRTYGVTVEQLIFANCLTSTAIYPGHQLYVPNVAPQLPTSTNTIGPVVTNTQPPPTTPQPTNTLIPPAIPTSPPPSSGCGPPASWVTYIVQPGDTVYSISSAYSITVNQLRYANCLTSTAIYPGQQLWVPNVTPNLPNG
jgi:LysM repeat protein